VARKKKVDDLSENGATRLMAALATQEIRDVFDGKGDIELAKESLHLLLSIIAGAVPNVPTSKAKDAIALWQEAYKAYCDDGVDLYNWFGNNIKRINAVIAQQRQCLCDWNKK